MTPLSEGLIWTNGLGVKSIISFFYLSCKNAHQLCTKEKRLEKRQWCCGLKRAEFRSWPISSSLAPERSQQCYGGAVPSCALPSQIWSCLYKEEARSCCFPKEENLWNSTKTAQILVGILERKQMMKLDDYFLQRIVNLIKEKVRENVERLGTTSIFGFEKSYLPSRYFLLLFFIVKISWKSQCFSSFYLIRNRK